MAECKSYLDPRRWSAFISLIKYKCYQTHSRTQYTTFTRTLLPLPDTYIHCTTVGFIFVLFFLCSSYSPFIFCLPFLPSFLPSVHPSSFSISPLLPSSLFFSLPFFF